VAFEWYVDGTDATTPHNPRSATKTVTSQNFRDAEAHPLTEALLEQHVLAALPTWAPPA